VINKIDEIINTLRSDTELTSLLKGQFVYWVKPSTSPPPATYVLISEVSNDEAQAADDEEYADEIEIQADIWTAGSTIPITKRLQVLMRKKGFTHQAMPDLWDKDICKNHKSIRFLGTFEIV
jgi:hypothetical protein